VQKIAITKKLFRYFQKFSYKIVAQTQSCTEGKIFFRHERRKSLKITEFWKTEEALFLEARINFSSVTEDGLPCNSAQTLGFNFT
jgi:hypothetical protein